MQMEDDGDENENVGSHESFSLLQDKALPFSTGDVLVAAACCPTMDLIALASKGKLIVQRSIKWERLFTVQSQVTCMAWRPDGCVSRHVFSIKPSLDVVVVVRPFAPGTKMERSACLMSSLGISW